ncbi:MAG TPA: PA2169 family four-helix-bundle protein [Phenylobacterium sp.]|nr:PA2169 family four-helix-bundle protein [Phenylobacterium sp.]
MSSTQEHAVKVLNSLIETTLDSAHGYKEAAESSEDTRYKTMFSERSLKRMKLTGELQQEVRSFGGEPEQDQSLLGKAHNKFVDLKAAILGHDEKAIINEVERGEDFIKAKFEKAVGDQDLPANVRDLVSRAFHEIKSDHDEVSRLKHSLN